MHPRRQPLNARFRARRLSTAAAVVLAAAVIALAGREAVGRTGCRPVGGTVTFRAIAAPSCASPVAVCADVRFGGGLKGTGTLVVTGLIPTVDTPTTAVVLFTADTTLEAARGSLIFKDAGSLGTNGTLNYLDLATIVGGTGRWSGATGRLQIGGTVSTAGDGTATYVGSVCTP